MNFGLDMAALNGEPVLEGHSQFCQMNGHAKHTVDGASQQFCPRCGESVFEYSAETVEKYEELEAARHEVSGSKVSIAFRPNGTPLYRLEEMHKNLRAAESRLSKAVDALTPEEGRQYQSWRNQWLSA